MNTSLFARQETKPEINAFQLDAVEFLKRQRFESIDLIVTDPAYESLEKHRSIGTTTRLTNEWFDIFPNSRYPEFFQECYLRLKKNAHMYILCDEETLFVIKPIAEACGFKFWKSIIWDKESMGMGYHWRNQTERVAFFEKGKRKLNNLSMPDILRHKRIKGGYPTEKPKGLYADLISNSSNPGEVVADPFFGSGNGLIAAVELDRHAIGSDISDKAHNHLNQQCKNQPE